MQQNQPIQSFFRRTQSAKQVKKPGNQNNPQPNQIPTTNKNKFLSNNFFGNSQNQINTQFSQFNNDSENSQLPKISRPYTSKRANMPPLNVKTLKFLNNSDAIEIIPNEVVFRDIEQNQTYEMLVFVQNLSKIPKRIKILQPKTQRFRVDYDTQGAIAAGLTLKLLVILETSSIVDDYSDQFQIMYESQIEKNGKQISQKNVVDVPLYAYKPQPILQFEGSINMGFVSVNKDVIKPVQFFNSGSTVAKVSIEIPERAKNIVFQPAKFIIEPNSTFSPNLIFNSANSGVFRYTVEVKVEGQTLTKKLDINVTAVEYNKYITDQEGSRQESFEFGEIYFGSKKIIKGFLTNNTPQHLNFKISLRNGIVSPNEENLRFQTPHDQGLEMTEQIMKCFPLQGSLKPYSKIPIEFTCKSKVLPENIQFSKNYALKDELLEKKGKFAHSNTEDDEEIPKQDFTYTCIVNFDQDKESTYLVLNAKGIHPMLKFDKQILNFGECQVNDHREIMFHIQNRHKNLPVDINIPKMPLYKIEPSKITLDPFMNVPFIVSFIPNNVGKYNKNLEISFIDKQYKIFLKALGSSTGIQPKRPKTRGHECLPKDFKTEKNFTDEMNVKDYFNNQQQKNNFLQDESIVEKVKLDKIHHYLQNQENMDLHKETVEQRLQLKNNKEQYTQYLREKKQSRIQQQKDRIIQMRISEMNNKQGNKIQINDHDSDGDKNARDSCPVDLQWEVKLSDQIINEPDLELPKSNDPLFVLKPISKHEPVKEEAFKHFNPDPDSQIKKIFGSQPLTHKDTRDIHLELDGESLQKIFSGPKEIDFGEIYVKSTVRKCFTVKNDLRNSIKVQLQVNCPELQDSYLKPQIIPSSETAKFELVLCSQGLDDQFQQPVKYIINGRHEFQFLVSAKITQVKLDLDKQIMKFAFSEENNYMETSETLKITNHGNAPGKFSFDQDSKIFFVHPLSGEVPGKIGNQPGHFEVNVTYRPQATVDNLKSQGGIRNEEDKLILRVQDGQDQTIKCFGTLNEAKCVLKQQKIDLGHILVSKEEIKFFQIKNTSRIPAIFTVLQEQLPECCTISPKQGRIPADGVLEMTLKYCNNNPRVINEDIPIMIRGGKILKLPFYVQTVIPDVKIKEDNFDFGKVTLLGNSAPLRLTLTNYSNIDADLTLDMRGEDEHPDIHMVPDGIECLTVTPISEDDDESILKSVQFDDQDQNALLQNQGPNQMLESDDFDNDESDSSEEVYEKNKQKLYNFIIRANQSVQFELKFSPREEKNYLLDLPLALQRYGGKLPGIQRQISCQGLRPKFYADPPIVEFPRKIISNADKMFPVTQEVILQNVGLKSMDWKVQPETFENDEIFSIHPTEGRIEAQLTFRIKVSFNPKIAGHYEKIIPIFIDDPDVPSDQPSMELVMKGDAAFPKLLFDRKEVILPTVPLNVESKCIFKIYNDGYENLTLDHKVVDELQRLNINLSFPEGKTLGVAKNRIKVEATFQANAPISFTTKIIFSDSNNHFNIPISGTADNSILTNYQFMHRNKGDYNYLIDEKGAVQFTEDGEDSFQDSLNGSKRKFTPSITSKTYSQKSLGRTGLGYPPIPKEMLDFSKDIVKEWLNGNVLTTIIQNFPENIIEHNGEEIFQLLIFLTGQSKVFTPMQRQIEKQMKRAERAQILFEQYDALIRYLKTQGALLNHIRPQYLLCHSDYLSYVKNLPKEENFYTHSSGIKLSYSRFQYISADCWISLFYQILKMYYLSKVSTKIFKSVPNFNYTSDKHACPDYYTHGSNVYNVQEGILLKWLETNNEIQQNKQLRITNFEQDLAQGPILVNLIKNYISPLTDQLTNLFQSLKPKVETEEEYLFNATIVHKALKEIGLATTFKPSDMVKFSARENLLFLLQLYNALPNYIPKQAPIIFSCVLGESVKKQIELTNPTSKPISYWVKYDGCLDFKPEFEDCFQIQPKSTFKFSVTFNSRISVPVKGRLTFTNKKETNVQASALVFELKSQITGRISIKPWEIESHLYESKEFNIQVQNNFDNYEFGDFQISILHQKEIDIDRKKKQIEEKNIENKDKKKKPNNQLNPVNSLNKRKNKKNEEEQFTFQETPFIPSFFCKVSNIKLKKKATYNLSLNFVPMVYETQKCFIIFSDPIVGEFQHEITGLVKLPEDVIEIPRMPIIPAVFVEEQRSWPLQVPFLNKNINSARRIIESWQTDKKIPSKKEKDLKISQYQPILPKQPFKFPKQLPDSLQYEVELIQPHNNAIFAPKVLTLHNPKTFGQTQKTEQSQLNQNNQNNQKNQNNQASQIINQNNNLKQSNANLNNLNSPLTSEFQNNNNLNLLNENKSFVSQTNQFDNVSLYQTQDDPNFNNLNLLFNFKNPIKDYRCDIILKNNTLTDIRRYQLTLTACPKPIKATFELNAPAKEMIVQEIPIQNNTDKDWIIKIQLTQSENPELQYFYCQKPPKEGQPFGKDFKDFVVKKQSTGKIPLIFCPQKACKVEGRLQLTNSLTNDVFDYELKGEGEDPLAQDHIVINCIAKQTKIKEITINNPYKDKQITYKVQTDLIGASGDDTFTIAMKKKRDVYKLSLTPTLSGQYTGSITFTEPDGTYIWYTVQLNIESPPPQRCLDLTTTLRKAIAVDIELSNPYVDPATFEVLIEGEGLMGDQFFTIMPLSTSQYELMYMPLKTGNQKGSIAFVNEKLGEIWYELNLVAEDSGIIRLPQLKCELGKIESHEINLENPSEVEQRIRIKNNNPQNFEVHPEEIVIPPMEAVQVYIKYLPSTLDIIQQAEITLDSDDIGRWQYLCFGMGIPPTPFDPKILTMGLNKDYSTAIHFRNPFKEQIQIKVILDLEDTQSEEVIKLLKKSQGKITLNGQQNLQIPFTFTPTEIREYKANIVLQMNDKIQWVYPIVGVTESLAQGLLKVFKVRCRNTLEQEFDVHLPGISSIIPGVDDQFNFEIAQNIQKDAIFKKIFNIQCTKNILENPDDTLKFKVKFNPMKPFKQSVDFIIKREIGGLWKFKLNLESTPPVEDDVIIISSPLHKTSSVSFRLTNRKKQYTQFQAKFSPDSDAEFGVNPKHGTLEPLGTDGSKFTISFTPIQYGKTRQAKLIIETEEIYWSYIIKGTLPKYIPPVSQGVVKNNFMANSFSRNQHTIQNDLNDSQQEQPQKKAKKNFLAANIRKTKEESTMVHQINELSRIQQNNNNNQSYMQNRSSLSPPFNNKNNNELNKSKMTHISKNSSRMFTAPGGMRKKLHQ